jgi:hypothetical protein
MPRASRDGKPAALPNKRKLSVIFLKKLKPGLRKPISMRMTPNFVVSWGSSLGKFRRSMLSARACIRKEQAGPYPGLGN